MYPYVDNHHHWVLPEILAFQAGERPEKPFVVMIDGESISYAETLKQGQRVAAFLSSLGVGFSDRVVVLLPNCIDFVRLWSALGWLGAVFVPLNTGLVGDFLAHQIRSSDARVVVCHESLYEAVDAVRGNLDQEFTTVVCRSREGVRDSGADKTIIEFDTWRHFKPRSGRNPTYKDLACIMYTSGTTGPAKGVLMPHAHCYLFGKGVIDIGKLSEDDRYYITMPLFHANGLLIQLYSTAVVGATAAVRERFSASSWLSDIQRYGCTVTNLIGMMSYSIISQLPSARDRQHQLRLVIPAPNPAEHDAALRERFGVPVVLPGYGMTEANIPLWGRPGDQRAGTCGFPYDEHFEVRIVDPETDDPLPSGKIGEIAVRPRTPFGFMSGYDGLPEKTVATWRNMWFHTEDAAWMDETGCVTFIDRMNDCIRRGGENIASFELEESISKIEGILELAAFAVPSEGTEDEVMIAVVPVPERRLEPEEVYRQAARLVPSFAAPRYIEIVEELPKTHTERVRKQKLRERGVTKSTWDRKTMHLGK